MRAPLLLLGGIVVLSLAVARALSCVCSPLECDVLTDEDCPGGLTWDPCRCCKVCARVEGEPCGGLFGFSGTCAVGLQCVIMNLLTRSREMDEGVCTKIPGRWRRHCPHGPMMSGSGCNLVGEGVATAEDGNVATAGKCVCGPSVPWCPGEPRPYMYMTRHECRLNLEAKIAYDDLYNSGDTPSSTAIEGTSFGESATRGDREQVGERKESRRNNGDWKDDERATRSTRIASSWTGAAHSVDGCPQDSVPNENGGCKCADCPPHKCRPGQQAMLVRGSFSGTPGNCCPRYNCVPSDYHRRTESFCPEDSVLTNDGICKCVPTCPLPKCRLGQRPFEVRAAKPETPGSCCPLHDCRPSDPISWVKAEEKPQNCIHEGVSRKLGEEWKQNDCITCICNEDGIASCQTTMCKSCENAIPPDPGECCPHCPPLTNRTFDRPDESCKIDDCKMKCYHGFRTDKNNCPICECADDLEVDLVPDVLPEDYKVCPELPHCGLNCDLVKDEDGCPVCACQTPSRYPSPNVTAPDTTNDKRICPEVKCDLHCELIMDENDCTFCECKPPTAGCPPLVGCRKRCSFGYKTNKRGCPICRCRASCMDHLNETHPEGSTWHPNSCNTCTCEPGGRLNCKETICSVACTNPLPPKPGTCCPTCPITTIKENDMINQITSRGWGTVPITLIVVLALLCLLLIIHIVRSRFRGRLSPSEASYASYPPQYYKCVPVYDTPVHRNEKIVPL
ncbi:PREDICTED: cysteine-rich motor neuron 1 protein [Wasmannia auropunctata]|uniref:cysteine-rich motor neuron 1 protein n=1 Tax=Wasmannia auropunctata TaxID=64793 RepID=UPI0005EF379D|nr:PREDICTED: cysteine-rich motor neuron 1 protein [Wasmannia auropunctata]XP_011692835.1 PREDICTED: cysteine-rich motor neuron 1 protein [Wasmannia auropunctata]XP_011692844.1 PREDICTED: cysteine-rich motor neuron 1 protein [Wasmannia auropunctata]XP_011692853.1 PREDICTED: cysteine-rich motor neuron 1 protein [Wasmannia auropunctata]XP_011692864.1 PREDICTED: cysteine-rich motor neuron 1 protein [Wasmannia auropunctata]XP_011692873.1 PREDICTED: cysteine-rich motor neuron 1 protein [Wasmannia a